MATLWIISPSLLKSKKVLYIDRFGLRKLVKTSRGLKIDHIGIWRVFRTNKSSIQRSCNGGLQSPLHMIFNELGSKKQNMVLQDWNPFTCKTNNKYNNSS